MWRFLVCFQHNQAFVNETRAGAVVTAARRQFEFQMKLQKRHDHEPFLLQPASDVGLHTGADDRKCFHEQSVINNLETSCWLGDAE